jgi:hypothetical protein
MKRDWFQIITNLGVIFGLVVLIYQINQSHQQAEAEMVVESIQTSFSAHQHLAGEDPGVVIAKARVNPGELTYEERVIFDAYNRSLLDDIALRFWMADIGIWEEDGRWRGTAISSVGRNLAYPAAREWWRRQRGAFSEDIRYLVDEGIQQGDMTEPLLAPYQAQ